MGIETRKNSLYLYRKVRRGRRVVSQYLGGGRLGMAIWEIERLDQQERRAAAQAERAERRRLQGLLADERREGEALDTVARQLARLALAATGHRLHKGQWRRRRLNTMSRSNRAPSARLPALPALPARDDTSDAAVKAILARATDERATPDDLAALRRLFRLPVVPQQVDHLLHFCRQVQWQVTEKVQAEPYMREGMMAEMRRMRERLGYDQAPELERGLIEHVVTCWMKLQVADYGHTTQMGRGEAFATLDYWERRLNGAQQRYLRAVDQLARVRRVRVELVRVTSPDGTRAEAVAVEGPAQEVSHQ